MRRLSVKIPFEFFLKTWINVHLLPPWLILLLIIIIGTEMYSKALTTTSKATEMANQCDVVYTQEKQIRIHQEGGLQIILHQILEQCTFCANKNRALFETVWCSKYYCSKVRCSTVQVTYYVIRVLILEKEVVSDSWGVMSEIRIRRK